MKKIIIFIALFASVGGSWLQAQDTLWMKVHPLSNYFYNRWIDTTQRYGLSMLLSRGRIVAKQFVTEDTLQVYGIAAMMVDEITLHLWAGDSRATVQANFLSQGYEDTTLNNCEESLLLFQYRGNGAPEMQQLGDSLHVHVLDTAPSYYVMSNTAPGDIYHDMDPKPVYERYFSEPQTVSDTFYAGWTMNHHDFKKFPATADWPYEEVVMYPKRPYFSCCDFFPVPSSNALRDENVARFKQPAPDSAFRWEYDSIDRTYFIFPILTPKPEIDTTVVTDTTVVVDTTVVIDTTVVVDTTIVIDTTVTDTTHVDTVAIRMPEFMGRYVSVSPNPATGSTEVLSSFGVNRVEVFSAAGQKVMDRKAEGLKATLDLSNLPSGTYLLRIHTPQGVTTKKLVVR